MLDNETKRRIDEARDILVGKLPDPKSQVEQITIALIYKFMYDMDKEALDFGGKATFFTGEWEKYNWINIFDPKIGGHEMLNLYGEAIVKLNQNPNIPPLFRDIFKNAYLPYRDPETLKLFLKTINGFTYDHSERLGDAFEYLLSVLGSQGDAGQFRTPRHIIDFIVAVLQPKKNETICDPACGTAGFLISSYKYIVEQNTKKNKGDLLTPDDKKKMMQRFTGYDISPDMVRLSLVNMYLHNFTTPKIYEYDTLTSEERWNESFDIIMANPPFMSPKGGIKPHKKFTMQANRSEVLFVDYIAEHINPATGRAGVIVPEGIIFQSANAYKQLRQLLVDKKYLYAVVSLPAGIFQPYSGVKTSILLMDRTLAKKTDNILFVKIENDGFDLGAQRRAIDKNDLTAGLIQLQQFKDSILNNAEFKSDNKNVFAVDKKVIKGIGDYNLSIDRYRTNENKIQSSVGMIKLGDVCEFVRGPFGGSLKKEIFVKEGLKVYEQKNAIQNDFNLGTYYIEAAKFKEMERFELFPNDLIISCSGTMGKVALVPKNIKRGIINQALLKLTPNVDKTSPLFVKFYLESDFIQSKYFRDTSGAAIQNVASVKYLKEIPFPHISLSIQQQIVDKIESYQAIINGAKQVVQNYKPQIDIDPDWEMVELGEVCEIYGGGTPSKGNDKFWTNGSIKWISSKYINNEGKIIGYDLITQEALKNSSSKLSPKGSTILITRVSVGKTALADDDYAINQDLTALVANKKRLDEKYLFYCSKVFAVEVDKNAQGIGVRGVTRDFVSEIKIPLPHLMEQQQIVSRIEQEQQLVNANKELIKIYEQKIKDEINKLWKPAVKEYEVEEEKVSVAAEE